MQTRDIIMILIIFYLLGIATGIALHVSHQRDMAILKLQIQTNQIIK